MMAIVHWGDTHMVDERGRPLLHQHRKCNHVFDPVMVCSECNEPLFAKEVVTQPGPGAQGRRTVVHGKRAGAAT